jgi:hypothetical protein
MLLDENFSCIWSNQITGATYAQYLDFYPSVGSMSRHIRIGLVNGETNADGNYYVSIAEAEAYSSFPVDGDGDGLDDDWEVQYGFDPTVADDTTVDADGDGADLEEEFAADTNPSNPNDRFRIQPLSGTQMDIRFPTSIARLYSLEWSTNLVDRIWDTVSGQTDLQGTGEEMTLQAPTTEQFRYYRIKVSQ